jgi:hypothetical protein
MTRLYDLRRLLAVKREDVALDRARHGELLLEELGHEVDVSVEPLGYLAEVRYHRLA